MFYNIAYIIISLHLHHIICTESVASDYTEPWPRFYHMGESTHPTQAILNNLTYYRDKWRASQTQDIQRTYTFTMAWDCTPCDVCLRANKFINVDTDVITALTTSKINEHSRIMQCDLYNTSNQFDQYKTIDELYDMLVLWVETGVAATNIDSWLIIELMLHQTYLFPMAVKLSHNTSYIAWDIECFEPGHIEDEDLVCQYTVTTEKKKWTFWITQQMQSFLGWSMIFLILVACSLGYCINCLKKKKAEKIEAWRAKEEKSRQEEMEREKEQKRKKKKRKGSKSKHRPHSDKSRKKRHHKDSDKSEHEYSNVPVIVSNVDRSSDENVVEEKYDVVEEKEP